MMNILYINLGEIIQFIRVSVFFQHSEDILKIRWYTNNHDNFGHYYRGVKFSYLYIPTLILKQTGWTRHDAMWHGHCGHVVIVSICSVLRRMLNRLPVSSAGGKQHFTPESSGRCWLSSNLWRVYCSVQQSDTWGGVVVSEEAGGLACASALTENIFLSSDLIVCVCHTVKGGTKVNSFCHPPNKGRSDRHWIHSLSHEAFR